MKARLLSLLFVCACAQAPRNEASAPARADTSARMWVSEVRAAHAAADGATTPAARKQAFDALRALAAKTPPPSVAASDAASTRRDLFGRAARLALTLGQPSDAEQLIQQGLLLEGRDPYRAQLLLLSVETQRALGNEAAARAAERTARDEIAR